MGIGFGILSLAIPTSEAATVKRLTPPSALFAFGDPGEPVISRFLPGQRFDLQATLVPDPGTTIQSASFLVDGVPVGGTVSFSIPNAGSFPADSVIATLRAYSNTSPGVHQLTVKVRQSDGTEVEARGNFEVVRISQYGRRARNVIFCIGDGLGIAHRTAARIMMRGVQQGKANGPLAMDLFPSTALIMTHSLNSIITDSSPGAACYSTGNKANNNQQGVFPDDTTSNWDNPRVELIGEYLWRTQGKTLGIVTTSDVFDATPGAFGTHTQSRGAGTGICDQYLDEAAAVGGLRVLLGGGRKWFLPITEPGSARAAGSDYSLPPEAASAWGVPTGTIDPGRDLIADFVTAGFSYVSDATGLGSLPADTQRLLGLFSLSNMNVAKDKIDKRRDDQAARQGEGGNFIVDDYGLPDQPMLDEMTAKAIDVLNANRNGFTLMVEAASIDKQAHNMDTERWLLDTIEFDRAVEVCRQFALRNPDTLVIVTADHECAGVNIIGAATVDNATIQARAAAGSGIGSATSPGLRAGLVGTYESAGFPSYALAPDGYPVSTDPDRKMLIGYAANADRYEDWLTNPRPLRDSQQPFNNVPPLNTYPTGPVNRDATGNFFVTGQINDPVAAHTASDIPLSAMGRGSSMFVGVMDNTDVFFKALQAVLGGAPPATGIR